MSLLNKQLKDGLRADFEVEIEEMEGNKNRRREKSHTERRRNK